jgi:hypothetical protein
VKALEWFQVRFSSEMGKRRQSVSATQFLDSSATGERRARRFPCTFYLGKRPDGIRVYDKTARPSECCPKRTTKLSPSEARNVRIGKAFTGAD